MTLSLKQVEKRKKSLSKKKKTPEYDKDEPTRVARPWKDLNIDNSIENEIEDESVSSPSNIKHLIDLAQKNSYIISKFTKNINWLQQIKLYPKVNIPIPRIFHQIDKED
ncbi:MAG: hypothetical protein KDD58_07105 [Bdellovibrionales bacterium]|nr:hypothetical protein [Bdellovibrionales bacterium]